MELTEIATRELRHWHLAEEEKTSRFPCGENPSNSKKIFSQSRRRELLPHWIPAWRLHVWGNECGQSRSQQGGSALSFCRGWSSCPRLLWVCPGELMGFHGARAGMQPSVFSFFCPGVKPFFQISLCHLGCSGKLMERNPLLGADSGAGEISANSSELLC